MLNGDTVVCNCRLVRFGDVEPVRDTGRQERGALFMNLESRLECSRDLYWVLWTDGRIKLVGGCRIGHDYEVAFKVDARVWVGNGPKPHYRTRLFGWDLKGLGTRGSFCFMPNGGGAAVKGGEPKEVPFSKGLELELGRGDPDFRNRWNPERLAAEVGVERKDTWSKGAVAGVGAKV